MAEMDRIEEGSDLTGYKGKQDQGRISNNIRAYIASNSNYEVTMFLRPIGSRYFKINPLPVSIANHQIQHHIIETNLEAALWLLPSHIIKLAW